MTNPSDELTEQELALVQAQLGGGMSWLAHDITLLAPTMALAGIGVVIGEPVVTIAGILTYATLRLRVSIIAERDGKALISAMRKLLRTYQATRNTATTQARDADLMEE